MKDHVAIWDKIKRQWEEGELDLKVWDHIFTRGRPSKKKFAKACSINPSTFKHYAHGDVCKRTKIGTKLGRKKSTSMDRKVREGKLIKKARENIRLQEEAYKSWDHRSMYQWLRKPELMRFDDPLRNIPNTKVHIQKGDKALQEILDKMEARMSYQKTERILKKSVTTL